MPARPAGQEPHAEVPASTLVPVNASAVTFSLPKPLLTSVQLVPLPGKLKTPPVVPANRLAPPAASACTYVLVGPRLFAVQLAPSSIDRNTPPP